VTDQRGQEIVSERSSVGAPGSLGIMRNTERLGDAALDLEQALRHAAQQEMLDRILRMSGH
jgi:hypothetical protein